MEFSPGKAAFAMLAVGILSGYLYQYAFHSGDLGAGAAVGWLLTLIILVVSLIQIRPSNTFGRET